MKKQPVLLTNLKLKHSFIVILILLFLSMSLSIKVSAQDMTSNRNMVKPENVFHFVQNTLGVSSPDSTFQMLLPGYLTWTADLDKHATLQFKNVFNETYMLVYQEDIDYDALQGEQMFFVRNSFVNKLRDVGAIEESSAELDVNGNLASQYEVKMQIEGVDLSYLITFIESQDKFFKIYFWTLSNQKEAFFLDFKKSVSSFLTGTRGN